MISGFPQVSKIPRPPWSGIRFLYLDYLATKGLDPTYAALVSLVQFLSSKAPSAFRFKFAVGLGHRCESFLKSLLDVLGARKSPSIQ